MFRKYNIFKQSIETSSHESVNTTRGCQNANPDWLAVSQQCEKACVWHEETNNTAECHTSTETLPTARIILQTKGNASLNCYPICINAPQLLFSHASTLQRWSVQHASSSLSNTIHSAHAVNLCWCHLKTNYSTSGFFCQPQISLWEAQEIILFLALPPHLASFFIFMDWFLRDGVCLSEPGMIDVY